MSPQPTAIDALRTELGLDRLEQKVDTLIELVEQLQRAKPFYTVEEAAKYMRKGRLVVEQLLADGRLWVVEGLDTSKRLIPQAALDSLQERPTRLTVAGS